MLKMQFFSVWENQWEIVYVNETKQKSQTKWKLIEKSKFNDNFVNRVKEKLDEGNIAIIANVNESSNVFINDSLKEFNCDIYRTIVSE